MSCYNTVKSLQKHVEKQRKQQEIEEYNKKQLEIYNQQLELESIDNIGFIGENQLLNDILEDEKCVNKDLDIICNRMRKILEDKHENEDKHEEEDNNIKTPKKIGISASISNKPIKPMKPIKPKINDYINR